MHAKELYVNNWRFGYITKEFGEGELYPNFATGPKCLLRNNLSITKDLNYVWISVKIMCTNWCTDIFSDSIIFSGYGIDIFWLFIF